MKRIVFLTILILLAIASFSQNQYVEFEFQYENKIIDLDEITVFYISDGDTIKSPIKEDSLFLLDTLNRKSVSIHFLFKKYHLSFPYMGGDSIKYYYLDCNKKWTLIFERRPFKEKKIQYSFQSYHKKIKYAYFLGCGEPHVFYEFRRNGKPKKTSQLSFGHKLMITVVFNRKYIIY